MASGSFNLTRTSGSSYNSFKVNWSSSSNGTAANSSTVNVAVYVTKSSSSSSNTWGTSNTSVTVNGETKTENGLSFSVSPGGSTLLFSKNYTVPHNSDGSKSTTISVSIGGDVFGASGSATVTLDTIPRQASITAAPNFTDDENPTITYSNPAGNSVSTLQACISLTGAADDIKYRDIPKTGTSYTFNLTEAERNVLRNATLTSNTRTVYFYVKTIISGSTYLSNLGKTLTIANPMPELTVSAKDTGGYSVPLTGNANKIIKGFNYVNVSMSANLKKGATIKSQTIINGGQTLIGAAGGTASMSGGFNNVENNTFIFGLTDSRGNTVNEYITLDMIDYVKLTCNLTANNPTADGEMSFAIKGNYFSGSFGAVANTLVVQYRMKEDGGEYGDWTDLEPSISGDTYSVAATLGGLDYQTAYVIQARAIDKVAPIETAEKKIKTTPVFDWGENDFQFNVDVFDKNGGKLGVEVTANDYDATLSSGKALLESGWVTITPVANTPTAAFITFKRHYAKIPVVLTTASSGVIGTQVLGCATNGITNDGVNIVLTRTNTTPTTVYYYVFGEVE